MTGTAEAPTPSPIPTFTDIEIQFPWTVEHVEAVAEQPAVETEAQIMLDLAESLTLESTRGNMDQVLFRQSLVDHSPLEKPGDEPKRRPWDLRLIYGESGKLEEMELSTGYNLQSIRARAKTAQRPAQISYFGTHLSEGKKVLSEKNNHPLWIKYSKLKLQEFVAAAATEISTNGENLGRLRPTIDTSLAPDDVGGISTARAGMTTESSNPIWEASG